MISAKITGHFVGTHQGQVQGKTQFGPCVCGTMSLMSRPEKHITSVN
jgi:hypothetical protein